MNLKLIGLQMINAKKENTVKLVCNDPLGPQSSGRCSEVTFDQKVENGTGRYTQGSLFGGGS
jgi:hypothetical protein